MKKIDKTNTKKAQIDDLIKKYIFESFPFKNDKNEPLFREHQFETIKHICDSILKSNKKFHMIEGPVGCGKSVINFTAARAAIVKFLQGKCTMLTSMKALQDQIASEGWPEIKSLKGVSGYACSHCQGMNSTMIKCSYDGEDYVMCNNSNDKKNNKPTIQKVLDVKTNLIKLLNNASKVVLRFKTNFASADEFDVLMIRIRAYFRAKYEEETSKEPELRSNQYKRLLSVDECVEKYGSDKIVDDYVANQAITSISCSMKGSKDSLVECGMKSARVLSRVLGIRLLNPDIFYYLTMQPSTFSKNEAIIIDESHGWASVMNRIFDIRVPVDALAKVYGINLSHIYKIENKKEILDELIKLRPEFYKLMFAIKTIRRAASMVSVKNRNHIKLVTKSSTELAEAFSNFANNWFIDNPNKELDVVKYIDLFVFQGKGDNKYCMEKFFSLMKDRYENYLENADIVFDDDHTSVLGIRESIVKWVGRDMKLMISRETKNLFDGDVSHGNISFNSVCNVFFMKLRDYFEKLCRVLGVVEGCFSSNVVDGLNLDNLSEEEIEQKKASSAFGVYKKVVDGTNSIKGTSLEKLKDFEREKRARVLDLSVVDPGKISRLYFYSKAEKVIFTSGTWVHLDSMMRSLGIGEDESTFYRIKSTFDKNRRPIYVVNKPSLTNFSESNKVGMSKIYTYKTEEGAKKFIGEVQSFIKTVQDFMEKNYGNSLKGPPNILIHSHSFAITKLMVEYGEYDDKWKFHTSTSPEFIRNKVREEQVITHGKDETIDLLCNNHDSGYVFVSPSISEGVDFKYGAARAQIILKFPIPNITDPYIRSISNGDPDLSIKPDPKYIDRLIWSTLAQTYGRVMRDDKDWGFTFLFDQFITKRFMWLFSNWSQAKSERLNINNPYFMDAVRYSVGPKGRPVFKLPFKF